MLNNENLEKTQQVPHKTQLTDIYMRKYWDMRILLNTLISDLKFMTRTIKLCDKDSHSAAIQGIISLIELRIKQCEADALETYTTK